MPIGVPKETLGCGGFPFFDSGIWMHMRNWAYKWISQLLPLKICRKTEKAFACLSPIYLFSGFGDSVMVERGSWSDTPPQASWWLLTTFFYQSLPPYSDPQTDNLDIPMQTGNRRCPSSQRRMSSSAGICLIAIRQNEKVVQQAFPFHILGHAVPGTAAHLTVWHPLADWEDS